MLKDRYVKNMFVLWNTIEMYVYIFTFLDCSVAYASIQLVKENSDIVLKCPFRVESKSIIWLGPKEEKLTSYSIDKK